MALKDIKSKEETMTDEEFCKLQRELEEVYLKLVYLQYKYRKETGRDFVFGQRNIVPKRIQRKAAFHSCCGLGRRGKPGISWE